MTLATVEVERRALTIVGGASGKAELVPCSEGEFIAAWAFLNPLGVLEAQPRARGCGDILGCFLARRLVFPVPASFVSSVCSPVGRKRERGLTLCR